MPWLIKKANSINDLSFYNEAADYQLEDDGNDDHVLAQPGIVAYHGEPLADDSDLKPDPSLVPFPVIFLVWKRVNGVPLCMLTICAAYSVRETSHTVPSSTTFAGLANGIHANTRSNFFAHSL